MRLSELYHEIRNICGSTESDRKCVLGPMLKRIRLELNDPEGENCRWDNDALAGWITDGIKRIKSLRVDALYELDGSKPEISEITAATPEDTELPLYEDYFDALFHYVCARALSIDSEDTGNQARSVASMENFGACIQQAPRLLTKPEIIRHVNAGIKEIRRLRPEATLNSRNRMTPFENIPECGLWTYSVSGGNEISGSFDFIDGWTRESYPTLYLEAGSDSFLWFYLSESDRAGEINPEGCTADYDQPGQKIIQSSPAGKLHGTIYQNAALPQNALREINATEPSLPLDDLFITALTSYVCFKALSQTGNERAALHYQNFTTEIYGARQ